MPFTLDTSRPTVVAVGAWNPAILGDPAWIARHVLKLPPGVEIEGKQHISIEQNGNKKEILEFESLAWSVFGNRLEFFCRNATDLENIYSAIGNVASCLPHTPVLAIGVNFFFVNPSPSLEELGSVRNFDELSDLGRVLNVQCSDSIEILDGACVKRSNGFLERTILKLERTTNQDSLSFNFNFHAEIAEMEDFKRWTDGKPIQHWREYAVRLMSDRFACELDEDFGDREEVRNAG
jgi:hypothetical protein